MHDSATAAGGFAGDVARDLQRPRKQLQSQYLYDALGSSLFDAICRLPWYRITRAEGALLAAHAPAIVSRVAGGAGPAEIVELGVGNGEKLAVVVAALPRGTSAVVHLLDISQAALEQTAARLGEFAGVSVMPHAGTYEDGLAQLAERSALRGRRLVLFLGSNIGNFDADGARTLMRRMRAAMREGDALLLGADLVKPEAELLLAYDDPLGVTAAFNKNLLVRINRELGADFDLASFDHRAVWNADQRRVEMHLVSRRRQRVLIPGAGLELRFEPGESIWTESSYKYTEAAIAELGRVTGFAIAEQWTDTESGFALTLYNAP